VNEICIKDEATDLCKLAEDM